MAGTGTEHDPWQLDDGAGFVGVHDVPRRVRGPARARLPGRVDEADATA